jgi:hypothetical protein
MHEMQVNIRWSAPPKAVGKILLFTAVRAQFAERGFRLEVAPDGKFTAHAGTAAHSFGTLAAAREWFHATASGGAAGDATRTPAAGAPPHAVRASWALLARRRGTPALMLT